MTEINFNDLVMAPPSKPTFIPSPLQKAVFDAVDQTNDSLLIEAVAGSGKTTTIVKACNYIPSNDRTCFLAFNKSIQLELQARLPHHIKAMTFHSLGFAAVRDAVGKVNVNFKKTSELMDETFGRGTFANKFSDKIALQKLISFAKGNGHYWPGGVPSKDEWLQLIEYHDQNYEVEPIKYLDRLSEVYEISLLWKDEIDFDDMQLHPIVHNYELPKYDNIICDESQDLSSLQHEILRRSLAEGGRVIAVGDTHQAIYGFRGADSSSMGNLKKMFSMRELPLNVSYRCSKVIAEMAQEYVPHFECLPDATTGDIETTFDLPDPSLVEADTLVLCRLNAPLFKYGMSFLNRGVKVQLWTNLDKTLKAKINSFKAKSTQAWRAQLSGWSEKEIQIAEDKQNWSRIASIRDQYETLMQLSEGTSNPKQIIRNLTDLTESKSGPILSTIHKAKGHEANKCLIVNFDAMPSRFAKLDWMMAQEYNLIYVAITRAKTDLILHYNET